MSFCDDEDACVGPQTCVGHYPTGDGPLRRGVCHASLPGVPPGAPCTRDGDCAQGVCAGHVCRRHCRDATDCPAEQACIGLYVRDAEGGTMGAVAVCDAEVGDACASQAACAPDSQCLLVFDPRTLSPTPRCGLPTGGAHLGARCGADTPCDFGLICAGGVCALPCPGGDADCLEGQMCQPVIVDPGASTLPGDDVIFDACAASGQ